jgi:hypothetical protein
MHSTLKTYMEQGNGGLPKFPIRNPADAALRLSKTSLSVKFDGPKAIQALAIEEHF